MGSVYGNWGFYQAVLISRNFPYFCKMLYCGLTVLQIFILGIPSGPFSNKFIILFGRKCTFSYIKSDKTTAGFSLREEAAYQDQTRCDHILMAAMRTRLLFQSDLKILWRPDQDQACSSMPFVPPVPSQVPKQSWEGGGCSSFHFIKHMRGGKSISVHHAAGLVRTGPSWHFKITFTWQHPWCGHKDTSTSSLAFSWRKGGRLAADNAH